MDDEMRLHIELHAEALEQAGWAPEEARRRAVAEFGGVQRYREEGREARAFSWVHDFGADLRYGVRMLRRVPLFTTAGVLSLGLGIGANVAVFGLLYGVLMQPLAIPRPRELTALVVSYKGELYTSVLRRTYVALRDAPGAPRLEAMHEADDILIEAAEFREYSRVEFVEGGFFSLVGVPPSLGRVIEPGDEAKREPVVVISDNLWTRYFARHRDVLGKQLLLRGHAFTVIGVMPRSFRGVRFNGSFTRAVPAGFSGLFGISDTRNYVNVLARIDRPALRAAFSVPLDATYRRCCVDPEETRGGVHVFLEDASRGIAHGKDDFRNDYRLVLWSLMGGVALVLLIACSNVGNLLLARGAARARELSIRLSIGASRWRVVRQLLAESVLLAVLGALVGVILAAVATRLLVSALPPGLDTATSLVEFGPKWPIIAFAALAALVSVLAFGVGPALRATRSDAAVLLRDRGGDRRRDSRIVDRLLVVVQVAVTLVLVCGAGLLVATLRNLRAIDPGFVSTHLVAIDVETRGTAYELAGIVPIHREILDRARGVPGVLDAAMATRVPAIGGRDLSFPYTVVGQPRREGAEVEVTVVTPGYLATTRTPILAGRDFVDADTPAGVRVAIANEAFIRRHFPVGSPLGAMVRIDGLNGGEVVTIVGVARDVRLGDRRSPPNPMLHIPAAQAGKWPFLLLLMRTAQEPQRVVPAVEHALEPYAHRLRIGGAQTMDDAFDEVLLRERLAAALASTCAMLALVLAMVGLGGLVGFSVARRTREIGVRMALGARRVSVVWLVLRGALAMAMVGVLIGGPLALGAGRALESLLYGIAPTSLLLLGGAASALVGVAMLASAAPAWRAARVDPVVALRSD
jgi:predicted permease